MLYHADVVQWLRGNQWLVENGFMPRYHAILADPPYNLSGGGDKGFMNQSWDGYGTPQQFQAWVTEWARLMLSFVHPGALLVMAGGTRTYHRLAAGLEDAGWEVADAIFCWHYGSGFPKSLNISKAIDAQLGAKREVVGIHPNPAGNKGGGSALNMNVLGMPETAYITAPATPQAVLWEGYGTSLKPSVEPFVIARAPRSGYTYADLALTFGSGAINVDGGRVAGVVPQVTQGAQDRIFGGGKGLRSTATISDPSPLGRFPANTLFTCECDGDHRADCPIRVLDAQSGILTSGARRAGLPYKDNGLSMGKATGVSLHEFETDSGGASRFFYQAKASAWEREAGLTDFAASVPKRTSVPNRMRCVKCGGWQNVGSATGNNRPNSTCSCDEPEYEQQELRVNPRANIHPTVKPIQLCTYLAKLILPPPLDMPRRLLVPFAGVGSEMIGAHFAGWDEIDGVELTAEYIPINEARRKWWGQFTSYEQAERAAKRKPKAAPKAKAETGEQLSLFAA